MVLSDKKILELLETGIVSIIPFTPENLNTGSYDVSLGEYYYRQTPKKRRIYNPYDKAHVTEVWGTVHKAVRVADHPELRIEKLVNIEPEDMVIILEPRETILAHTVEFIGGKKNIITHMQARSSIGRNDIGVCKCAGWGDVGYVSRWTMEITNFSEYLRTILVVGRRVAQIVFPETYPIRSKEYGNGGKYQYGENIDEIQASWKPEMMLPRLYLDREIKNPVI